MIRRDRMGRIHAKGDVFAMHRRQLAAARERTPEERERYRKAGGRGGRMRYHVCNRGGRLNGWPVCWFCYVESRLGENR